MGQAPTNDLRIVLLQHDLAWEDKPANQRAFASLVADSAEPGSFVILPELCDVGFTMRAKRAAEPRACLGRRNWPLAIKSGSKPDLH